MKSNIRTWLTLGTALMVSGILLFLAGYAFGGSSYVKMADLDRISGAAKRADKKPDLILEKTKIESFQEIHADLSNMDLLIKPSEDENAYISYKLQSRKGKNPLKYSVKDAVLTIEEKKKTSLYSIHVNLGFLNLLFGGEDTEDIRNQMALYIPEQKELKDCRVLLSDGNMEIEGISCENSEIEMTYGDFSADYASFYRGSILVKDGSLEAENTEFSNVGVTLDYGDFKGTCSAVEGGYIVVKDGDMKIKETNISDAGLELHYGNMEAEELMIEKTSILAKDGNIHGSGIDFRKENSIKNHYGNVKFQMLEDSWGMLSLRLITRSGKITVPETLSGTKENREIPSIMKELWTGQKQFWKLQRKMEILELKPNKKFPPV